MMEILDQFDGRNGQITVAQERKTGARLYVEEGVKQSYVLPGGSAGLDYVRLMVRVLKGAPDIILFGCGGGGLASELHSRGCRVTVVDNNPISFEIARRYFWMPASVREHGRVPGGGGGRIHCDRGRCRWPIIRL
jgi:hypothetical protein